MPAILVDMQSLTCSFTSGTQWKSINPHIYVGHRSGLPVNEDGSVGILPTEKYFTHKLRQSDSDGKALSLQKEIVTIYFECIYVNILIICDKMEAFTEWILLSRE